MSELEDTIDFDVVSAVKKYMNLLERGIAPAPEEFAKAIAPSNNELLTALEGLLLVHRSEPSFAEWERKTQQAMDCEPIGDFQLIRELGRGGMGIVYEARQRSLGRLVALKILPFASALDEVRLQRFRNEAHAAAALHHTNIVPVYAVGHERGVHYYAMQLIDGRALSDTIAAMKVADQQGSSRLSQVNQPPGEQSRPNSTSSVSAWSFQATTVATTTSTRERLQFYRWAVRLISEAAMALEQAHRYGVIHRDIKPSNLLLDSSGKIWLTDFGLAQIESETLHLTRSGNPMGTMRYMSPEQAQGNRLALDHRTDIYSLGITLYEILTLTPAFDASNFNILLDQVINHDPPNPCSLENSLPSELAVIISKAIAKLPEDRYETAEDFADDLKRWLNDEPIVARPPNVFERMSKWRRRNSGIVASAGIILTIACLCLSITTALVWNAQGRTQDALQSEQQQRKQAEKAFQRARAAVDAYSQLSESELTLRPDLQNLRRSFLETSLEFYREFIDEHGESPILRSELERASHRVSTIVSELRALDDLSPYLLLTYVQVQEELNLPPEHRQEIEAAVEQLQFNKNRLWEASLDQPDNHGDAMSQLLADFELFISERLDPAQKVRLLQIDRQVHLPFTFRTTEIERELALTDQQKSEINRIIIANRPRLADGAPLPNDPRGKIEDVILDGANKLKPKPMDLEIARKHIGDTIHKTTASIVEVLTPKQQSRWAELVGDPLTGTNAPSHSSD